MLERKWSKRNSHSLVGMQNSTATLKEGLSVSSKTKHILTKTTQQSFSVVFTPMN